jgi:hypothetical protein
VVDAEPDFAVNETLLEKFCKLYKELQDILPEIRPEGLITKSAGNPEADQVNEEAPVADI